VTFFDQHVKSGGEQAVDPRTVCNHTSICYPSLSPVLVGGAHRPDPQRVHGIARRATRAGGGAAGPSRDHRSLADLDPATAFTDRITHPITDIHPDPTADLHGDATTDLHGDASPDSDTAAPDAFTAGSR
jgi:hypothetical protein